MSDLLLMYIGCSHSVCFTTRSLSKHMALIPNTAGISCAKSVQHSLFRIMCPFTWRRDRARGGWVLEFGSFRFVLWPFSLLLFLWRLTFFSLIVSVRSVALSAQAHIHFSFPFRLRSRRYRVETSKPEKHCLRLPICFVMWQCPVNSKRNPFISCGRWKIDEILTQFH